MEEGAIDPEDGDTICQAIRILALKSKGVRVDVGPAGQCSADAYAAHSAGSRMVAVASSDVAAASLATISSLVLRAVPPAARVSASELTDMLERHANNEFGVSCVGGEVIATASFVGFFHILNHSCWPNVVFDSAGRAPPAPAPGGAPLFSLVALQDIEAGEELCHSYSDGGPDELLELYGFECGCPRCAERSGSAMHGGADGGRGADGPVARAWQEWQGALECTAEACGAGDGVRVGGAAAGGGERAKDAKPAGRMRLRCVHCAFEWVPESGREAGVEQEARDGRRRDRVTHLQNREVVPRHRPAPRLHVYCILVSSTLKCRVPFDSPAQYLFRIEIDPATSIVAAIARVRCKSVSSPVTDATDTRQQAATTKWTPPTARNCAADCIVQCPQNTSSAHSSIRAPSVRKPSRVMSPQL